MMKKNGFTLAEVLITLAIIGVVATMTLPALMNNTAEQQAITGLKKGINTLTEAAQMSQAVDGFDFSTMISDDTSDRTLASLYAMLANRTNVDFGASGLGKYPANTLGAGNNYSVFLRDGSAVIFTPANVKSTPVNSKLLADGLPDGVTVVYDTNGLKAPNILSNCTGVAAGATTDNPNGADCNDKSKRVIKDQFSVRLRGGYAVPRGAAAKWAFEK